MTEILAVQSRENLEKPQRSIRRAVQHGVLCKCPSCGKGKLFRSYLKVNDHCPHCGEVLHHHRADDAPPYITITLVGHIVVALLLMIEVAYMPPLWLHALIWIPLILLLALGLLPLVKGAVVGLQWANFMHGFASDYRPDR